MRCSRFGVEMLNPPTSLRGLGKLKLGRTGDTRTFSRHNAPMLRLCDYQIPSELLVVEFGVKSSLGEQRVVRALLDHASVV